MNVRRQNGLKWVAAWGLAVAAIVGVGAYGSRRYVGNWLASAPLGATIEAPIAAPEPAKAPAAKPAPVMNSVLEPHIESLRTKSLSDGDQGVYVATLDGTPLVEHNEDRAYNPASVMKLATTLAALDRFGPGHRFTTTITFEKILVNGVLEGNLGVRSDGDPTLDNDAVRAIVTNLKTQGLKRVTGDVVVAGPLTVSTSEETVDAADRFRTALVKGGIAVDGGIRLASDVDGVDVIQLVSEPLVDIVQLQNAYSINRIADNLGTAIGGPSAVRSFLIEEVGLEPRNVLVTHTSGLDENLLTAEGTAKVVVALYRKAAELGIPRDRLMPLAGVDSGTMRTRFSADGVRGSVLAKTGTQPNVDFGVATLAGIAYTRDRGPVVFAIMNSHGDVHTYRDWEDSLLKDVIARCGGPAPIGRLEDSVPPRKLNHEVRVIGHASAETERRAASR